MQSNFPTFVKKSNSIENYERKLITRALLIDFISLKTNLFYSVEKNKYLQNYISE